MKKTLLVFIAVIFFITVITAEDFNSLLRRAEKGDAEAQCEVGDRYLRGTGIERNMEKAYKWTEKSALQDFPEAQFNMGVLCSIGFGGGISEAVKWYEKSAESGYPKAQESIAAMYYHGTGVEVDKAKAKYWLKELRKNPEAPDDMKDSARIFLETME
jgi:hypothetical protein